MSAARPEHVVDADFAEVGEQRRTERRAGERRLYRLRLDPLFAATLISHVAGSQHPLQRAYAAPALTPLRGLVVNLEA